MKSLLTFLLFSISCLADSMQLPSTGFLWVDRNPSNIEEVAYTISNLGFGAYTPTEEIYSLQFSAYLPSSQFFYRTGELAFTGTFNTWSFQNGLFVGNFSGNELNFYAGTWMLRGFSAINGTLSQQLTVFPGCYWNDSGCGLIGRGLLTLGGQELAAVPEPESWMLMLTGLSVALISESMRKRALLRA